LPSLLFEIGCEELPASACAEAEEQLRSELAKLGKGSVLVGPRRLVLLVDDVPEREPDEWVKGPPEKKEKPPKPQNQPGPNPQAEPKS